MLKPSDKSLTAPKSPQLSTSTLRLNDISRNAQDTTENFASSHRLSMALVDASLLKKYSVNNSGTNNNNNTSKCANNNTCQGRMQMKSRTVSQNDLRF